MSTPTEDRIANAWRGRVAGCLLGKPVERLSMQEGYAALQRYLVDTDSDPTTGYIGYQDNPIIDRAC